MNGLRPVVIVTALFGVVVLVLLGLLPFWLDEVLQLIGTQPAATIRDVVRYVPQNPGGVPLGYLVQHAFLALAGVSRFTARVPPAAFGIASVWLVGLLARRLGIREPWMAAAVFAVLPISLRYATEARPYSQAIFLSVAGLFTGFRLAESPEPATSCYARTDSGRRPLHTTLHDLRTCRPGRLAGLAGNRADPRGWLRAPWLPRLSCSSRGWRTPGAGGRTRLNRVSSNSCLRPRLP